MENHIWAKTILTSYRYLERLADAIDSMIENRGLNSRVVNESNYALNNIYYLADKLIELGERKIKLINLKVLTEDCLKKCGDNFAKILIAKYIDQKTNGEAAKLLNLAQRTYFRRLNDAEKKFEAVMALKGFDTNRLEKYLSSEKWIMEIKDRLDVLHSGQEFEVETRYLNKLAVS